MKTVPVSLGERSYPILIGEGLLAQAGKRCRALKPELGKKCAIITDSTVGRLYAASLANDLEANGFEPIVVTIPAGEASKSLNQVQKCYDALAAHRLERKSFVIALGGGVVGDLAGFVAASYLRGVPFVQLPTTLLSQVDSSVGGKVGVNLKAGKNLVGAFYQPRLVLCDLDTLQSLPEREFRAGLAEVIKYGIIYDEPFFKKLERNMPALLKKDVQQLSAVVARSCEIKAEVVGSDETESGLRAILNYGHTIGHALEAITRYGTYLHGEAISIGQVAASHISARQHGFPAAEVDRVRALFQAAGLPTTVKLNAAQRQKLFAAMSLDKKVSEGEVKFVLARKIGHVDFGIRVPRPLIEEALDFVSA